MSAARRRLGPVVAGVLAAGLTLGGLVGGAAGAASAHDFLVGTDPAADSTVGTALDHVTLTFNEPPLTDFATAIDVVVTDPAGATVSTGDLAIVDATLTKAVAPTTPGLYTVLWQTVSSDGHPVSGEYTFTYAGPPAADTAPDPGSSGPSTPSEATPGAATTAPTPDAASDAAGTPSATVPPTAPSAAGGVDVPLVLIGVGAGALVLVVVAIVLVLTRRRSPS